MDVVCHLVLVDGADGVAGVQTRWQRVKQAPAYGGAGCPNVAAEHRECLSALCADCSDTINGPQGQRCFNEGACVDGTAFDGAFTCKCIDGFTGSNCQLRMTVV